MTDTHRQTKEKLNQGLLRCTDERPGDAVRGLQKKVVAIYIYPQAQLHQALTFKSIDLHTCLGKQNVVFSVV